MIQIKDLSKKYQNFSLDCTLTLKSGQITGLVGQNGAGKSTLFKATLGLIAPDGGSVIVLGKDIKDFNAKDREDIGVVLSDSGFSGYLTIKDMIPVLKNLYSRFDKDFFVSQAKRFGLPFEKKIKDFSSGMKAKLKVIVAVSHNARLLILDEPTSGLDVVARDDLLLILREFMETSEDNAILISSHISSDLESLCDDIYMIHEGKIILHEDTDVLLGEYGLLKVGADDYDDLDKEYIMYTKEEAYGYSCLTNQKRYYVENYPHLTVENGSVDGIVTMMIKGDKNEGFTDKGF